MKILIISVSLLILISGCSRYSDKTKAIAKDTKQKTYYVTVSECCGSKNIRSIHEYTINGCQYIGDITNSDACDHYLTHKGNCTNHKK